MPPVPDHEHGINIFIELDEVRTLAAKAKASLLDEAEGQFTKEIEELRLKVERISSVVSNW